MLNLQSANKLVLNLKNDKDVVLRLSCYPIAVVKMATEYSTRSVSNTSNLITNGTYTLVGTDFDGFAVILINSPTPVKVAIPRVRDIPEGRCVSIGQDGVGQVMIKPDAGVTVYPLDACLLRRDGSMATLLYLGNNTWRLIGEIP